MVFFLAVVSVVFILGGGAGALYGADMIRTETGGTIALSGVAVICAGFLLLALVLVLVELRRIRDRLDTTPAAMPVPPQPAVAPPAVAGAASPVGEPDEKVPPAAMPAPRPVEVRDEVVAEPSLAIPPPPPSAPSKPQVVVETLPDRPARRELPPLVPPPPPPPRVPPPEAEPSGPVSDDLLADEDEAEEAPARDSRADDRPGPKAPAEEAGKTEPAPAPEVPKGPRTPVATYNSGANTYFMYADGTIEAETARGRYRFASMTELRHYAETGEGGIRIDGDGAA